MAQIKKWERNVASVTIREVIKSYNQAQVIHGVNVDIDDGEFVVLVGPSGCGKSTLLRMIAGIETISDGKIFIGDRVINSVSPKDRDIAMVFQSYALYPHMTVAENMAFSLKLRGEPKYIRQQKVEAAASILNLSQLLSRYPRQLSGGQRQRVAMGRAIVREPQVFLFDEPLSNLDAQLRVSMRTEIKALHQRLKTTMIYVTHDQVEAMTLADKIVVMRNGFVEQVGSPLELYDQPANRFVAGFIGSPSMNFLQGKISKGRLEIGGSRVGEAPIKLVDQDILCGVRPEHMYITTTGSSLRLAVEVIEPTGAETIVQGKIGADAVTCTFRERLDVRPGGVLDINIDTAHIHLFDPKSEQRLN